MRRNRGRSFKSLLVLGVKIAIALMFAKILLAKRAQSANFKPLFDAIFVKVVVTV